MWPFSRPAAAPVIRLFTPARAAACAAIHAGAFHRGWSAQEIAALGMEPSVLAHVALDSTQTSVLGFSLARCAGQEAEILTIVVDAARRGRGLGRLLLQTQLDALALQGVREVFLEAGLQPGGRAQGLLRQARPGARHGAHSAPGASLSRTELGFGPSRACVAGQRSARMMAQFLFGQGKGSDFAVSG